VLFLVDQGVTSWNVVLVTVDALSRRDDQMKLTYILPLLFIGQSVPSFAQEEQIFAKKPFVWKETPEDERILNTKLLKALPRMPMKESCDKVAASLLAAFAEATPYFHKKDDRFPIFSVFTAPINSERFPAHEYLLHMLRRAAIDRQAPKAWLKTARNLKEKWNAPIDLARMEYAVEKIHFSDSIDFGITPLFQKFQKEVVLAPTISRLSAWQQFRNSYLDRDIAWPQLILSDVQQGKSRKSTKNFPLVAHFQIPLKILKKDHEQKNIFDRFTEGTPVDALVEEKNSEKDYLSVKVVLAPRQYIDPKKMVVSQKYLVRGRIFEMHIHNKKDATTFSVEIRDGLAFDDRDWSGYSGFATADNVKDCDLCVNDLSPFGLGKTLGKKENQRFSH
jgi:hypothetical protein